MFSYLIKRFLYAMPIIFGVNFFVFLLFFFVNTPDDMARLHLGTKRVTQDQIERWKKEHSVHFPYFYNAGWVSLSNISAINSVNKENIYLPFSLNQLNQLQLNLKFPNNYKLLEVVKVKLKFNNFSQVKSTNISQISNNIYEMNFITEQNNIISKSIAIEAIWQKNAFIEISFEINNPNSKYQMTLNYKDDISFIERFTKTIFFTKSLKMIFFEYGKSEDGKNIKQEILKRAYPSLTITIPAFLFGLLLNIFLAMILAYNHRGLLDRFSLFLCSIAMSISTLFYVIFGQFIFGVWYKIFPISGFDFQELPFKFIFLPVLIAIISGIGGGVRFYRTIFLEEINREYVLTARSKGLSEYKILFVHVLKNAMIPVLTSVVTHLPFLFIGSLLLESFFSIPGLGAYLLEAIQRQDFSVVQSMVSLGSFLYILGLILTDISYKLVDPRVKLK